MTKTAKTPPSLHTADIPQADSLPTIRTVVESVEAVHGDAVGISKRIKVSDRHVRYRLQSARVLGLIDENRRLTVRGRELLSTSRSSEEERKVLVRAVNASLVVSQLFPELLAVAAVDVDAMAKAISRVTGMSHSTAHRRARGLRSWRRQLSSGEDKGEQA